VPVGNYIADFLCSWKKLIIELVRFWNHDVLTETESILEIILNELNKTQESFSPTLPPPQ